MSERFDLLQQVGKGGMGVVWKARDNETGEVVALKLLHELYLDDEEYVSRLEREVEIARRIDSPHVVKVTGFGRRAGVPYVAMEYVEGQSLRELLRERGTLTWDETKRILRETAEGLAAVHAADVVHRDIKPSNILIASDGTVKLADFGIARAGNLTQMTSSSTMLGTPAYMSPDIDTSERSDLYGLGCVLFEMLTGAPPFPGDSQQQVFLRHIREAPDVSKLPPEARATARWLLEKEPSRRAPSAAAVAALLSGSSKRGPRSKRAPRKRWQVAAVMALPLLLAIGGASAVVYSVGGGSDGRASTVEAGGVATKAATASVSADATQKQPPTPTVSGTFSAVTAPVTVTIAAARTTAADSRPTASGEEAGQAPTPTPPIVIETAVVQTPSEATRTSTAVRATNTPVPSSTPTPRPTPTSTPTPTAPPPSGPVIVSVGSTAGRVGGAPASVVLFVADLDGDASSFLIIYPLDNSWGASGAILASRAQVALGGTPFQVSFNCVSAFNDNLLATVKDRTGLVSNTATVHVTCLP